MLELAFNLQFNLKLEVKRQNENFTKGAFPRLSSSLTLNWSLNVFDTISHQEAFPRLTSSLTLNWRLNARSKKGTRSISTFKLQFKFNLKLKLKRVRPNCSSRVAFFISTFKLQFNLKLKLKRVRHFTLLGCFLPFPPKHKKMATMKEKAHYNKTDYCRCQTKAIATVYRKMSQEKKDIVEEMGFGVLANVPEMNVSNRLLKELLDRFNEEKGCLKTLQGKIYITPRKVAAALCITNVGNCFPKKVDYNNLNPADKECAGHECRRGGEPEKNSRGLLLSSYKISVASPIHKPPIFHVDYIQEWDWAKHVLNFLMKRVENKRNGKKQSVDGCVFVLILIYFHETKFPHPFAPNAPPAPWVAHWTRKMMIEWILSEATKPLGLLYRKKKQKEVT
ncbi:hypothetical protein Ahy_B02g059858 [Arachis hypogaea]|uniref:Uncharacterized protein n=1 Tax=Arachis hypogaea TaxID=3818 RepID=A0A445AHC4_ARAHY|nr:hypothetical protein Ahy_B02g059858 [Arachis hypogaea]